MLDPAYGEFDHVVAMDSLIHYRADDLFTALALLPRGPVLRCCSPSRQEAACSAPCCRSAGSFAQRSLAQIVPISEAELLRRLALLPGWTVGRSARVSSGFYKSHAIELVRRP
jgi:magnesium-protoporphyrin O-methyltransferase